MPPLSLNNCLNRSLNGTGVTAFSRYSLQVLKFLGMFTFGSLVFYCFRDWPYVSIILLDVVMCGYLTSLFKKNIKYLFLLHPVIILVSSQLYITSFLMGGDGEHYSVLVNNYIDSRSLTFQLDHLLASNRYFVGVTNAYFGVVPVFVVPEYFFNYPADKIYYLWQGTFHVILCAIAITISQVWAAVSNKYLLWMALFAVISPTFFELGVAPTRHYVTFFAIFIIFISYCGVKQRLGLLRMSVLLIGISLLIVSKMALLIPVFVFICIDQLWLSGQMQFRKNLAIFVLISAGLYFLGEDLIDTYNRYGNISRTGAATFADYVQIPLVGWIVKYIYALLSPFPWSDAGYFISTTYGGNWFLFMMHVLSSLIGVYMFLILLLKYKSVFTYDPELTKILIFGLIMSLSIIKGTTGFHGYLSIYFPFFSPLLAISKFRINFLYPLIFILTAELFVVVMK